MGKWDDIKLQMEASVPPGEPTRPGPIVPKDTSGGVPDVSADNPAGQAGLSKWDQKKRDLEIQPTIMDKLAEQPDSASFATVAAANFPDDPRTQLEIYADARGRSVDDYGVTDGQVVYRGDDGKLYPETAGDFLSQSSAAIGRTLPHAATIGLGTVGAGLGGPLGAAVGAGLGEGIRKGVANVAFDEPQTLLGNASSIAGEMATGLAGDAVFGAGARIANKVNKGMVGRKIEKSIGKHLGSADYDEGVKFAEMVKERYGLDINAAQMMDSEALASDWRLYGDMSPDERQIFETKLADQVQDAISTQIKKVGTVGDKLEVGEALGETGASAIKKAEEARSAAYRGAMKPAMDRQLKPIDEIDKAAVVVDGKAYTGVDHGEAFDAAVKDGAITIDDVTGEAFDASGQNIYESQPGFADYFTTKSGNVVDRQEALKIGGSSRAEDYAAGTAVAPESATKSEPLTLPSKKVRVVIDKLDEIIKDVPTSQQKPLNRIRKDLIKAPPETPEGAIVEIAEMPMSLSNVKDAMNEARKNKSLSFQNSAALRKIQKEVYDIGGGVDNTKAATGINKTLNDHIAKAEKAGNVELASSIKSVKRGLSDDFNKLRSNAEAGELIQHGGQMHKKSQIVKSKEALNKKLRALKKDALPDYTAIASELKAVKHPYMKVKGEDPASYHKRIERDYRNIFKRDPPVNTTEINADAKGIKNRIKELSEIERDGSPVTTDMIDGVMGAGKSAQGFEPETNFQKLHRTRMDIGDLIDGSAHDANKMSKGTRASIHRDLTIAKKALKDEMIAEVPEYERALRIYQVMSGPISKIKKSNVGSATKKTADNSLVQAVDTFFKPGGASKESVARNRAVIEAENPEVWDTAVATYLNGIFAKATKESRQGGRLINPAGNFYGDTFGSKPQREILKAALSKEKYEALKEFADVLRKISVTSGKESTTATRQAKLKNAARDMGGWANATMSAIFSPAKTLATGFGKLTDEAIIERNSGLLIEAMANPTNSVYFDKIKGMSKEKRRIIERMGAGIFLTVPAVAEDAIDDTEGANWRDKAKKRAETK